MKLFSENAKLIAWFIEKVGMPFIFCAFLAYLLVAKFDKLERTIQRGQRNQAAIMKKLGIKPVPMPEKER